MDTVQLIEIDENTYVGRVKDLLEMLASWTADAMNETYYANEDSVNLDDTHILDAENLLDKMVGLINFCHDNGYKSDKVICIDLGYDYEGIKTIRTLKEESEI